MLLAMTPSRDNTLRFSLWLSAAFLLLYGAFQLGQLASIGSDSWRTGSIHIGMTLLLIPLIRYSPDRGSTTLILLLSVLARLLIFPMHPSDDVHRYVWEGRAWQQGYNPYLVPPDDPALAHLRTDAWEDLNHPDMTAIYPPGAILLFGQCTRFSSSPMFMKTIMTAADLGTLLFLLGCLHHIGRRPEWALLYALHPVTLLSFAGEGHLDSLLILGLVATLYFDLRKQHGWAFVALAMSFHAKYISILLLPFLLRRETLSHTWAFLLPLAVLSLPFLPLEGIFTSLTAFSSDMHYNDSVHHWLGEFLDSFPTASNVSALAMVLVLLGLRVWTPRLVEAAPYALGALLLLSPNVHFWYVAWSLPFLCIYPIRPLLFLGSTIAFSYATQGHLYRTGEWFEFEHILLWEYLPVYLLLGYTLIRPCRPRRLADAQPAHPLARPSIVVPTMNEGEQLAAFLQAAFQQDGPRPEVLVCDCGSTDETVEIATRLGAKVFEAPRGRGHQIATGIRHASGDYILVAHADMMLAPDVLVRIREALMQSGQRGGCVGCTFESDHLFLAWIGHLNRVRASLFGISFGDQGQFIRTDALPDLGGFPDIPLMEDVEFSLRLKSLERPLYIGGGIRVSARRWTQSRKVAHTLLVVKLVAQYQVRRLIQGSEVDVTDLYEQYYGGGKQP